MSEAVWQLQKPGGFPSNMPFYPAQLLNCSIAQLVNWSIGQLVKWLSINSEEGCGSAFGKFFVIQAIRKVDTGSGGSFDLLF